MAKRRCRIIYASHYDMAIVLQSVLKGRAATDSCRLSSSGVNVYEIGYTKSYLGECLVREV